MSEYTSEPDQRYIVEQQRKHQALAILRLKQVLSRTGLSRSTIYGLIKDGKFPAQILLSSDGRAVGWIEQEIDDYLACQIEASRKAA